MIEQNLSYLRFLLIGLHYSKKYNLKFQCRLYKDLIDNYCFNKKIKINDYILNNENYLDYSDLNVLYNYTKNEILKGNLTNLIKYGYIYCCYKLKKVKNKLIVLMMLNEDFIKYYNAFNIHNYQNDNETYINFLKSYQNLYIYEQIFYNVNLIPGYAFGYYLFGKIYEKESKRIEILNKDKKENLLNISLHCYYLAYKSFPFLISAYKKLIFLYNNFYAERYIEVKKVLKLYDYRNFLDNWYYNPIKKNEKIEEIKEDNNFDNNILELLNLRISIDNCNLKIKKFLLSLLDEKTINIFFLKYINNLNNHIEIYKKYNHISKEIQHDISTIGKMYFYLYSYKFKKALYMLDQWKHQHICSSFIYYFKGLCYFLLRNYEKAIQNLKKIFYIDINYTKHLPILSTCYWHKKKINEIESILFIYPKKEINEHYLCLIGNYFSLKENKKLAIKFFKKAICINPFYEYAYILCASELKNIGNIKKAVTVLKKCYQLNLCNYKIHLLLSVIFFEDNNIELANIHLTISLKLNITDPIISLYASLLYEQNKKYETALLCLQQAKKNFYNNIDVYILQGIIYIKMNKYINALNTFLKVQTYYPKYNYINILIALTLAFQTKFEESIKIIQTLLLQNIKYSYLQNLQQLYECCNLKQIPSKKLLNLIYIFYKKTYLLQKNIQ